MKRIRPVQRLAIASVVLLCAEAAPRAVQAGVDTRPHAVISAFPTTMYCPQQVSFDGTGSYHSDPARHIVSYEWDFKFNIWNWLDFAADSSDRTTSFGFGEVGTLPVALRVTDDGTPPQRDIATITLSVLNRPPAADAGGPYTVAIGHPLFLNAAASSDPDVPCGDRITYSWDFDGDGVSDSSGATARRSLGWEQVESLVCGGACVAGTTHEIGVEVRDRWSVTATARTMVKIVAAPTKLTVTSPNGREFLGTGRARAIRWESGQGVERVRVLLSADGETWQVIVPDAPAGAGSATWTPPPAVHTTTKRSWLIKVQGFRDGALVASDVSDAPFGIGPLDLVSTEKGQNLSGGRWSHVAWTKYETAGEVATARFEYSLDRGGTWKTTRRAGNPGMFAWKVPARVDRTEGCRARVALYDARGRRLGWDAGEGPFTIVGPVEIDAPVRGEALYGGTNRTVSWRNRYTGQVFSTRLRLSTDGGTTWMPLATLSGNPGHFHWSLPLLQAAAPANRIEVAFLDANGAVVASDRGEGSFAILARDATPPGPVTDFTATPIGSDVNLAWSNPGDGDFTGVRVMRRSDRAPLGPGDGTLVCDISGTSFNDTGVSRGYYAAFAHDAGFNFAPAATAVALRPAASPASIAVPLSSGAPTYQVSWGASATAGVTYELQEATDPDFASDIRSVYVGGLFSWITGRANGVTYYYRVRAYGAGWDPSAWVSGANGCAVSWDAISPGSVTSFTATAVDDRVDLAWVNPTDADFSGVRVLRRTDRFPADAADGTVVYWGTGQSWTDTGLAPGDYYYAAYARDAAMNYSSPATAMTPLDPTARAPSSITVPATANSQAFWVVWGGSPTPGVSYELEEATDAGFATDLRTAYTGPALGVSVSGRANGLTYFYRVRAVRAGWNPSARVVGGNGCAVSWDGVAPEPVMSFVARAHGDHVHLSWVNPTNNDLAGVRIVRRADGMPAGPYDGDSVYVGLGVSTVDSGLAPGAYLYAAFSYDGRPNFSVAAEASAEVSAPPLCEACHNGDGDDDGIWTGVGFDPDGDGPLPAAPNVMGDGVWLEGRPRPYDAGTWGYNVNGHGVQSPDSVLCTDCHDVSIPPGTHLDGVLNSVELKQNINQNTAHLNASWIGASFPDWSVQLTLDNACANQCHSWTHRHKSDANPAAGVVRFGADGSVLNGQGIAYPIDIHVSTNAPSWPADGVTHWDYAPCISCHNPHGTDLYDGFPTNAMLRGERTSALCAACHQ